MGALTALTRLKEQGVEESGLFPNHFPHADPGARRAPDGGGGKESTVEAPPGTWLCRTKRQLGQVNMCPWASYITSMPCSVKVKRAGQGKHTL